MSDAGISKKMATATLSRDALSACLGYQATVTELFESEPLQRFNPSVYEMIYNPEELQSKLNAQTAEKARCRWYHVPVNNVSSSDACMTVSQLTGLDDLG